MHVERSEMLGRGGRVLAVVALHAGVIYLIATSMGIIRAPALIKPMEAVMIDATHQAKPVQPVISKPKLDQPNLDVQVQEPTPDIDVPVDVAPPDPNANATQAITDANLQVTRRVEPVYPPASRRANEQGTVVFNVLVDESGHPQQINIQTSSGYDKLDQAAMQAIHRWMFNPAMRGSQKVTAWTSVRVTFRLENGAAG